MVITGGRPTRISVEVRVRYCDTPRSLSSKNEVLAANLRGLASARGHLSAFHLHDKVFKSRPKDLP